MSIKNLHVTISGKPILNGVDLHIPAGEIHFLMGPNGSGKSTLAQVMMGNPTYKVSNGEIVFNNEKITALAPDMRAQKGLYLGFQYPVEVAGVGTGIFLRSVKAARNELLPADKEFRAHVAAHGVTLGLPQGLYDRNLNEGFSGGEKKRNEILQLQMLQPKLAILDEFDSGLDVDGLKAVCAALKEYMTPERGLLLITHYGRIAEYIAPDAVHIMIEGRIAQSAGKKIIQIVEEKGFEQFISHEGRSA